MARNWAGVMFVVLRGDVVHADRLCIRARTACAEADLKDAVGDAAFKIGKNVCMKNQWLQFDKASKLYVRKAATLTDVVGEHLRAIQNGATVEPEVIKELRKRQLVETGCVLRVRPLCAFVSVCLRVCACESPCARVHNCGFLYVARC